MKIIIQCANRKNSEGPFWTHTGHKVKFVARPSEAPQTQDWEYAHPDSILPHAPEHSLRQQLVNYNEEYKKNGKIPVGLLPAWRLYKHSIYRKLTMCLKERDVLILSAGWGLVRADFLLPAYDITFSYVKSDEKYKRRLKADDDSYNDFCQIDREERGPVVCFVCPAYFPLLRKLTDQLSCKKVVYYASDELPEHPPE